MVFIGKGFMSHLGASAVFCATLLYSIPLALSQVTETTDTIMAILPFDISPPPVPLADQTDLIEQVRQDGAIRVTIRNLGSIIEKCGRENLYLKDWRYYDEDGDFVAYRGGYDRWFNGGFFAVKKNETSPLFYTGWHDFPWYCGGTKEWVRFNEVENSGTRWATARRSGGRTIEFTGYSIICTTLDRQLGHPALCTMLSKAQLCDNKRPRPVPWFAGPFTNDHSICGWAR